MRSMTTVGVISDTHGPLRSEALAALSGSDAIIHAGDVGDMTVIEGLRALAPVTIVRGNNDRDAWARGLPETEVLDIEGTLFYVLHILQDLDVDPKAAGFNVVVSGHSHRPRIETRDGVLFLNPGSAGPRRFKLPVSLARVHVTGDVIQPEIIELI
jgi:putative phosphoesterase